MDGELQRKFAELSKASGWYLALGVTLVIGGIAAIVSPMAVGAAVTFLMGWNFIFGGIA